MPRKIYYGTKKRDYKSVGNRNLVMTRSTQFFKNLIENFSDSIPADADLVRLHEEKAGEILRHFFILSLTFEQRALFPNLPPIHFVKKLPSHKRFNVYRKSWKSGAVGGLTADEYRGEVHIFLNRSQVSTRDMEDFMEVIIHEGIHVLEYRFGPWNLEGNEHLGHSDRFHHWCDELLKNKVDGYDWDPCLKRWKEEDCPFCIKRAVGDEQDQL